LLCAGYGTRMGALCRATPKPLLPLAGRAILDYLADELLAWAELDAIHVVTSSPGAAAFRRWAAHRDPKITIWDDGRGRPEERRGAVGDLAFVLERIGIPARALVAAGDNVLRFPLRPVWETFLAEGDDRVLALHEPDPAALRRTGVLELAGDRVVCLHEKPAEPPSQWACPPFYFLGMDALASVAGYLAGGGSADEIGRFLAHVVTRRTVRVSRVRGQRLDVGSPETYRRADALLRREPLYPDPC